MPKSGKLGLSFFCIFCLGMMSAMPAFAQEFDVAFDATKAKAMLALSDTALAKEFVNESALFTHPELSPSFQAMKARITKVLTDGYSDQAADPALSEKAKEGRNYLKELLTTFKEQNAKAKLPAASEDNLIQAYLDGRKDAEALLKAQGVADPKLENSDDMLESAFKSKGSTGKAPLNGEESIYVRKFPYSLELKKLNASYEKLFEKYKAPQTEKQIYKSVDLLEGYIDHSALGSALLNYMKRHKFKTPKDPSAQDFLNRLLERHSLPQIGKKPTNDERDNEIKSERGNELKEAPSFSSSSPLATISAKMEDDKWVVTETLKPGSFFQTRYIFKMMDHDNKKVPVLDSIEVGQKMSKSKRPLGTVKLTAKDCKILTLKNTGRSKWYLLTHTELLKELKKESPVSDALLETETKARTNSSEEIVRIDLQRDLAQSACEAGQGYFAGQNEAASNSSAGPTTQPATQPASATGAQ